MTAAANIPLRPPESSASDCAHCLSATERSLCEPVVREVGGPRKNFENSQKCTLFTATFSKRRKIGSF